MDRERKREMMSKRERMSEKERAGSVYLYPESYCHIINCYKKACASFYFIRLYSTQLSSAVLYSAVLCCCSVSANLIVYYLILETVVKSHICKNFVQNLFSFSFLLCGTFK